MLLKKLLSALRLKPTSPPSPGGEAAPLPQEGEQEYEHSGMLSSPGGTKKKKNPDRKLQPLRDRTDADFSKTQGAETGKPGVLQPPVSPKHKSVKTANDHVHPGKTIQSLKTGRQAHSKKSQKKTAAANKSSGDNIRRDKKGLRILADHVDVAELFIGDNSGGGDKDDFALLFEQGWRDTYQRRLHSEKLRSTHHSASPSLRERLKSWPAPQAELDLHGNRAPEAEERTVIFIERACVERILTVRLIVGKGLHSEGDAILPSVVEKKLAELKRTGKILTFKWEKKEKHKSGALIVYLPLYPRP